MILNNIENLIIKELLIAFPLAESVLEAIDQYCNQQQNKISETLPENPEYDLIVADFIYIKRLREKIYKKHLDNFITIATN